MGYVDVLKNLNLSFGAKEIKFGNIAMISQSGAMAVAFTDWALEHDLGFSKIISMGNKVQLSENELLLELEEDFETKVIVMYLESIEKGREFYEIAKRITLKKPIILVKSGMSDRGSLAASSHTGALAGSAIIFKTAFKQSGIIYTQKLEDFFLWGKTFSLIEDFKNIPDELAIITNAGGPGVMVTDHCEYLGVKLAEFNEEEKEILMNKMPETASVKNPIDIIGDATSIRYSQILENINSLKNKRAILVMLTPQTVTDTENIAKVIVEFKNKNPKIFVMVSFMGGKSLQKSIEIFKKKQILNFSHPQKAVLAYSQILRYKKYTLPQASHSEERELEGFKINKILEKEEKMCSSKNLGKVMEVLDLPFVKNYLVKSEKQSEEIFEKIGAKKILARISSEDIPHKTDIGGVVLDIKNSLEATNAYNTILQNVLKNAPNAKIEGIIYSVFIEQSNDLREIFIGLKRDETFGNLLIVGMGGIYVNVYEDVSRRILPICKDEIIEMFKSLKGYKILAGYRGTKSVDFDKIADIILEFIKLFESVEKIKEIDINPLFSTEKENYLVDVKLYL
ncbi:MAG: acetate--CoA ligase family protein [Candidatus Gracilibacteria bacterium]|nr:acetate--CoA ligase family protein [Candidatus Gracilibacteria bacterium]